MVMMTTTIRFSGDTVRALGLTVASVQGMIAEVECPADVTSEPNWAGEPAIVVSLTVEDDEIGEAASDELVEHVARTGIAHMVGYVIER